MSHCLIGAFSSVGSRKLFLLVTNNFVVLIKYDEIETNNKCYTRGETVTLCDQTHNATFNTQTKAKQYGLCVYHE